MWHLTYAGHIDKDDLISKLISISSIPVIGWSVVHEASDAEAPYEHTHVAWLWEKAVDLVGYHLMDVRDPNSSAPVHPNIESKKVAAVAGAALYPVSQRIQARRRPKASFGPAYRRPVAAPPAGV